MGAKPDNRSGSHRKDEEQIEVVAKMELITPAIAGRYLATNKNNFREANPRRVHAYARDMCIKSCGNARRSRQENARRRAAAMRRNRELSRHRRRKAERAA